MNCNIFIHYWKQYNNTGQMSDGIESIVRFGPHPLRVSINLLPQIPLSTPISYLPPQISLASSTLISRPPPLNPALTSSRVHAAYFGKLLQCRCGRHESARASRVGPLGMVTTSTIEDNRDVLVLVGRVVTFVLRRYRRLLVLELPLTKGAMTWTTMSPW